MKSFNVWQEGYSCTGNTSRAFFVGSVQAETFKEACIKLHTSNKYFNKDSLSVWGCRLFDNEADARRSFG